MVRILAGLMVVGVAATSFATDAPDRCTFGGRFQAAGTIVCHDGKQQQCTGGAWKPLGTACARGKDHLVPAVKAPTVKDPNGLRQPGTPHQPAAYQPPSP
jgi:hypothetical protein